MGAVGFVCGSSETQGLRVLKSQVQILPTPSPGLPLLLAQAAGGDGEQVESVSQH